MTGAGSQAGVDSPEESRFESEATPATPPPIVEDWHGTTAGWNRHNRDHIPMCDPCRKAHADYMRDYRRNNTQAREKNNRLTRAQTRALWRLKDLHPDEFQALVAEEFESEGLC